MRGHDGSYGEPEKPHCYTCGSTRLDTNVGDQACCEDCGDEWAYAPRWVFPDERIYRVWDNGLPGGDIQELTVVRVNRKTITVDTDQGSRFRLPFGDVVGFVDWEDGASNA